MVTSEEQKREFSRRLNLALDEMGADPKGKGRQSALGKAIGVSQKGARKWLEDEAIPNMTNLAKISNYVGKTTEWLLASPDSEADLQEEIGKYVAETHEEKKEILDSLKPNEIEFLIDALEAFRRHQNTE